MTWNSRTSLGDIETSWVDTENSCLSLRRIPDFFKPFPFHVLANTVMSDKLDHMSSGSVHITLGFMILNPLSNIHRLK